MNENKSDFKRRKVKFEAPEYVPQLKFRSLSELKKLNKSMLFWSENPFSKNPDLDSNGSVQNEFLNDLSKGDIFHCFILGETREGKGVTLENLAEFYKKNFNDYVIIDLTGKNYEGAFWAKKYKCYLVYHHLVKPKQKSTNPNVIEKKLNQNNDWRKLIQLAHKNKRILILMVKDPLDQGVLKAETQLFKILNRDEDLDKIRKILLLREISFMGYKHGILKATTSQWAIETKREFIHLCRTGRHGNNQMLADAQRRQDIDDALGDNVALRIIKRTNSFVGNYPKYIQDAIKTLEKYQAVMEYRGKVFTATIGYNDWHKTESDKVQDLGIFPQAVDLSNLNKFKENRYIDLVSEEWTNYNNRLVLGRKRHVQDPENTKLCCFELADLLGLECEIYLNGSIDIRKPRLVYGEIKFRGNDAVHSKIEIQDVKKTIQDLTIKKIVFSDEHDGYYWNLDPDVIKKLNWKSDKNRNKLPVVVEMITPNGATTGAKSLMKRHHINLRIVKIDNNFYE